MDRLFQIRSCLFAFVLAVYSAVPAPAFSETRLNLFVAASLTDVAHDLARGFDDQTGISVRIVPAATSTLARQIAAGAPADVFLSADMAWVDWLIDRNIGNSDQLRIFAGNVMVVVAGLNSGSPEDGLTEALDPGNLSRIAVADPDHVPAGRYAKQVLEADGRWPGIAARIVPAADVRSALRYVETGQTAFAFVYASDAEAGAVRIVGRLPEPDPPVRYVALPLGDRPEAAQFVSFLNGQAGNRILCSHGFRLPQGRAC